MTQRPHIEALPEQALSERFVRSRGPGGQNVNKVATAVQLKLEVGVSQLALAVRRRLLLQASHLASKDGAITIFADRFRSQARNREDALDRLEQLLHRAHQKPKQRIATRPTRASKERRLQGKQRRGATKASRSKPRYN
ncbi:MAG: alternative ribosome rescue aminoacyl-tRNA hydrolase ArfB [Pseudomonadales bacterium]